MTKGLPLYEQLARKISEQIMLGVFRPGDRLPSIRELSRTQSVAINTVKEAYYRLEAAGVVELRPRYGIFVRPASQPMSAPLEDTRQFDAAAATTSELWHQVHRDSESASLCPLGIFTLDDQALPSDALSRTLAGVIRRFPARSLRLPALRGELPLRRAVARRFAAAGCTVSPNEVLISSGCTDGLYMALTALTKPGDSIVVEHPFFSSVLQLWETLGLSIIEIPSSPETGVHVPMLEHTFRERAPAACILVSTFSNPVGSTIPAENKKRIAQLAARYSVPIIEDDVFGDLPHDGVRRPMIKSFDTSGEVVVVSSFSKTVAPGYRTGWIVPGRYQQEIERLKAAASHAAATPVQLALAEFLDSGRYDRHLRRLQRRYLSNMTQMMEGIERYFPAGTRFSRPKGGLVFWLEFCASIDTPTLYNRAREAGIAITPGTVFTLTGALKNGLRLSFTRWDERIEHGLTTVGELAKSL
ncbi:PLP-dependent aminotransferase family protein [Alkalispirochaeta sphaeroplastigenens]|nr:PLP-dependent aminotransferase family protein [Alkalispirochaeta sphaeroplastigenens]